MAIVGIFARTIGLDLHRDFDVSSLTLNLFENVLFLLFVAELNETLEHTGGVVRHGEKFHVAFDEFHELGAQFHSDLGGGFVASKNLPDLLRLVRHVE